MSRVVVVGAGVGGLAAALDLASRGYAVTVCEKEAAVGGKMRRLAPAGRPIDAGPTVLTMRPVFEALFRASGARLDDYVTLERASLLARHAWLDGSRLDLHHDVDANCEAIRAFAGPKDAEGYRAFVAYARRIHENVDDVFIHAPRPTAWRVIKKLGLGVVPRLMKIDARRTMWQALGDFFPDARLRQLFARYATYAGNSPFFAPATFNLIAWVEQQGVWRVEGGMGALAAAIAWRVDELGGEIRCGAAVERVVVERGRAAGVELVGGERIDADAVVFNGDSNALAAGWLGEAVTRAVPATAPVDRSLSALTWCVDAPTAGFGLVHHNVFFSDAYADEFDDIFDRGRLPVTPTVYVCAQDRGDDDGVIDGPERLLVLVNAPAVGDAVGAEQIGAEEIERCERTTFDLLARCGLTLSPDPAIRTSPADWARLFPATGGAIYGPSARAWNATLKRPGSTTAVAGLYLAGGSVHPGAGVPMCATSGRMAAEQIAADLPSTRRSRSAATPGGTSTRSATTADMR
ncbi:MAG: phytoene desaturase family protein [bacterium]